MTGTICRKEKSIPDPNNVDDLMDIQVPEGMIIVEDDDGIDIPPESKRPTTIGLTKQDENLSVDNRAILDCWDLTVASHDAVTTTVSDTTADTSASPSLPSQLPTLTENKYRWQAKDLATSSSTDERRKSDILKNWQPKALTLPPWAVDPFE